MGRGSYSDSFGWFGCPFRLVEVAGLAGGYRRPTVHQLLAREVWPFRAWRESAFANAKPLDGHENKCGVNSIGVF